MDGKQSLKFAFTQSARLVEGNCVSSNFEMYNLFFWYYTIYYEGVVRVWIWMSLFTTNKLPSR